MSRCPKRDKDLGQCMLAQFHNEEHFFDTRNAFHEPPPSSPSVDPIRMNALQAMNALSEAIMALNPTRTDLAVMSTNEGIMVFYDKDKGFPVLPAFTATAREGSGAV